MYTKNVWKKIIFVRLLLFDRMCLCHNFILFTYLFATLILKKDIVEFVSIQFVCLNLFISFFSGVWNVSHNFRLSNRRRENTNKSNLHFKLSTLSICVIIKVKNCDRENVWSDISNFNIESIEFYKIPGYKTLYTLSSINPKLTKKMRRVNNFSMLVIFDIEVKNASFIKSIWIVAKIHYIISNFVRFVTIFFVCWFILRLEFSIKIPMKLIVLFKVWIGSRVSS